MTTRTYQMEIPPEPAMRWEKYEELVKREWKTLLVKAETSERDFQNFFETHPCCIPQMYGMFRRGAHGPFPSAIVSQPILPGFRKKVPDFLYIARDSATVFAVLVEIEHPSKPWATAAGHSSAEFTQATNQIADWKAWFNDPLNVARFKEDYRIPQDWIRSRSFAQKYVLIYGRRSDPTLTEEFNRKRRHLERADERHMTFDAILPEHDASYCLCATLDADGYCALSIPATMQLGPMMGHGMTTIRGKAAAVARNPYLSETRKNFLIQRWPYWDSWSGGGMCSNGDVE